MPNSPFCDDANDGFKELPHRKKDPVKTSSLSMYEELGW
jgi:hypothetical protein